MKKNLDYFYTLYLESTYRLHPYKITDMFLICFIVGLMITGLPLYFFNFASVTVDSFSIIQGKILLYTTLIQLAILIFYSKEGNAIKYQKLQSIIAPMYLIKFAIDPIHLYWFICEDSKLGMDFKMLGMWGIIFGVVIAIISLIICISKINKGKIKKGGENLFEFKSSITNAGIPGLFGIVLFTSKIPELISGAQNEEVITAIIFFVVGMIIYLPIMYIVPEYIIVAYMRNTIPKSLLKK